MEIIRIVRLIVSHNYFKFREKTYLQKNGLAMGAPTTFLTLVQTPKNQNTTTFNR
jgi:uncharacterized SAM-binding protein YcdF (DUF218 family)